MTRFGAGLTLATLAVSFAVLTACAQMSESDPALMEQARAEAQAAAAAADRASAAADVAMAAADEAADAVSSAMAEQTARAPADTPSRLRELPPAPAECNSDRWSCVDLYYGTDRKNNGTPANPSFDTARAHTLTLGTTTVTVPNWRNVGEVSGFSGDPWPMHRLLYFTIAHNQTLQKDVFTKLIRERLARSQRFDEQALVFVHGYNNSFYDAAFRTAQIVYDMKFDGVALFYSWPSAAKPFKYDRDKDSATQAEEHMREFLRLIRDELGAKKIHLIAHSLGNSPLLTVLGQMRQENIQSGYIFEEIIIAAPDLDRDVFQGLSKRFLGIARWVTLYGSEEDIALAVSGWKASGERAGQVTADGAIIVKGVQAIDITELATGIFPFTTHHADFAESPQLIEDMDILMRYGIHPPDDRSPLLEPVSSTGDALYWRYIR